MPPDHDAPAQPSSRRGLWAKILASKFLVVSIAVHLLFCVGATLYVVQRYQASRRITFKGGAPTTNPSKRAMEQMDDRANETAWRHSWPGLFNSSDWARTYLAGTGLSDTQNPGSRGARNHDHVTFGHHVAGLGEIVIARHVQEGLFPRFVMPKGEAIGIGENG